MQRCLFLHPVAVIFHKGFHNGVFLLLLLTFLLQNLIRDPIAKARLERRVFTSIIRYRPFFLCCMLLDTLQTREDFIQYSRGQPLLKKFRSGNSNDPLISAYATIVDCTDRKMLHDPLKKREMLVSP